MHMNLNDLNKVWEVKPLKMAGENEAREILNNVAKQVQPIMHKHKWKVPVLSEFCPSNPSLMGLNIGGGAEIKLRLRRPKREWDFFPYEQILDTMLHELCHNAHGPHNADFYKLLDEIRLECEELMAKGITGTGRGFDLQGRRLSGFSRPPPLPLLRESALVAAERRAQQGALMPTGPRRLGGDTSIKDALSPIQASAMAAERRLRDEVWCGGARANNASSSTDAQRSLSSSSSSGSRPNDIGEEVQGNWQCNACTLINQPLALACEVCQTPRIKELESESGSRSRKWLCKFCTLANTSDTERCSACEEWRYSYGPPITGYTPYVGT